MGTKIFFGGGLIDQCAREMERSAMLNRMLILSAGCADVKASPKPTTADCAGCGAPLQRMARVCAYCAREH